MVTVVAFPGSKTPPQPPAVPAAPPDRALLPATGGRRGEYGIGDLARELRLPRGAQIRTVLETLRALARHDGMPLPRTPRIVKGEPKRGPDMICKASLWDAGEVDAWLDGRSGPGTPAAPLPPALLADLAARAADLAARPLRRVA